MQSRGERSFPPRRIRSRRLYRPVSLAGVAAAGLLAATALPAAPPGAVIANRAELRYESVPGVVVAVTSNEVLLTTGVLRSNARIAFTRVVPAAASVYTEPVGPAACLQGGAYVTLADPVLAGGNAIDPADPQDLAEAASYNVGEPLFLRLEDPDQNVDFAAIDTAVVTLQGSGGADSESIRLRETGPDTGVFAGYVPTAGPPAVPGNCILELAPAAGVQVVYTDPADAADFASASATLDPFGRVFDSRTGLPVDGATVTLVDVATGLPASVFGNDGTSPYPGTVVSGTTVTDGGGTSYVMAPGQFRFPVVPAGDYRLDVSPPAGYAAPSGVSAAELQLLPNAPFALGPASFGSPFAYAGDGPFTIDYPLDPQSDALFLSKSTTTTQAAPGDFVRYELVIENRAPLDPADALAVVDLLPAELRYVAGSARQDDAPVADPAIDAASHELRFELGNLAAGRSTRLSYVAEVVNGRRNQEVTNSAVARSGGGQVSNAASARFRLTEDLFRSTGTLIGRVVEGDCEQDRFPEDRGVQGVRVYLEDGRYAVTDEGGRYHFEGLPPGTHVAQLDPSSVPGYFDLRRCEANGRFAGRAGSQFVDLSRGALVRADFALQRKATPEGRVDIELVNSGNGNDEEVVYDLTVRGYGNLGIDGLEAVVLLPDGVSFVPGTARVDGAEAIAPRSVGQSLTFALGAREGNWQTAIRFTGTIVNDATGDLRARALARFDTPAESGQQTPIAEALMVREGATSRNEGYVLNLSFETLSARLSDDDRATLDRLIADWSGVRNVRITAVGHSDATPISAASRRLFADNYVLSRARAQAAASYVAAALSVADANIAVEGRGPDDPIAGNDSAEGRRQNRRVEMILSGTRLGRQAFLRVEQASSGTLVTKTRGLVPGSDATVAELERERRMADHLAPLPQVEWHINSLRPGVAWVTPQEGYRPPISALRIAVSHGLDQRVRLSVNGEPVSAANFEGTVTNTARTVAVSRWAGVDLVEGPNALTAVVTGPDGQVAVRLERSIHYAGPAVRAELVDAQSVLLADGRTRPVLAVRLTDRYGEPARHSSVGTFAVRPPYRSWWELQDRKTNKLVEIGSREPVYTIGRDGIAYIELAPTTESGRATLTLRFENQGSTELSAYLKPDPREWVLVGFGEGTVGYNTLRDNQVAAAAAGNDDGYYDEGRLAFFAKGRVRGDVLLTIAYDSDRERAAQRDRFRTQVDPDEYYTLYADNTEQQFEAPSQRKLYVKLERNQFTALFGDFATGLSATDLARYERRFNGFRSEWQGRHLDYNVFASSTDQAFVRDELQGDGTSGLYRLSTAPLVANSETIRIEVRDRFDPAVVVSSRTLQRFLDYSLDPADGTLYFKAPVPGRDADFNLVYIVAEYESRAGTSDDLVAGGRIAVGTGDDALEVGLTMIEEDRQAAAASLAGVDLNWQVSDTTRVRAEAAQTERDVGAGTDSARAEALSIDHRSDRLDLRAWYRRVEAGYGLGQQSTAEQGIRKFGADGRIAFGERLALNAKASQQENLDTGAERVVAEAELQYRDETYTASLGLAHAADEFADGARNESRLVTAGASTRMLDSRVVMRANGNLGLGDDPANPDYLSKYVLGLDYELLPGVDLFAEYEDAEGRDVDTTMTRLGARASPWHRAHFTTSLNSEQGEYGPRLFANYGLTQGFQVNDRWAVDLGLDQSRTLTDPGLRPFDDEREFASGSRREDYLAASLGALYQSGTWSINSRLEHRHADSEDRTTLVSGWYREPTRGHGLSAGLGITRNDPAGAAEALSADLRFGWAWRIADSRWSFFDRADLVYDDGRTAAADERRWRLINNFNANRRLGAASQVSLQYAFKFVRAEFGPDAYSGYSDLAGLDLARGIGGRWEAGWHASVYRALESGVIDYGTGVDLGYLLRDNVWVTFGYNLAGFHDDDFAAARYTAQGPFLRISVKADQDSLKRIAGR